VFYGKKDIFLVLVYVGWKEGKHPSLKFLVLYVMVLTREAAI
jgi:hypothetical protein